MIRSKHARLTLAAALAFASPAALAQAQRWQVSEAAGTVVVRHAGVERAAERGAMLEAGDAVSTGANGRAVLVHERDFVTLAPRSRVTVPGVEQATGFTKLLQDLGNAVYKIEKRGVPHFGVNTPYLAAVVKGTTFSITVDTSGTSLQVVEGAVEVATPDGGARDLIRPGSVATITAADIFRLRVHGEEDRVVTSPAAPAASSTTAEPASGTTSATVAPAAPPAAAPLAASDVDGSAASAVTIPAAIVSKPVDLGALSGGLMSGTAGVAVLTASVTQTTKLAAASPVLASAAPVPVAATAASTPPVVANPVAAAPVTPPATSSAAVTPPATPVPVVTPPVVTPPVVTPPVVTPPVVTPPVVTPPVVTPPVVTPPVVVPKIVIPLIVIPPIVIPKIVVPIPVADDDASKGKNNGNHFGWAKNGKAP